MSRFQKIPPQVCGMALGFCGLGSFCQHVDRLHGWPVGGMVATALHFGGASFALMYVLKLLSAPKAVASDLSLPMTCASVSPLAAAAQAFSLRLVQLKFLDASVGHMIVVVGFAMQMLLMLHFVALCFRLKARPEPFWLPPLAICMMTTITGSGMQLPHQQVLDVAFWISLSLISVVHPLSVWRTVTANPPAAVAGNPSCAVLMAPVGLVSLGWVAYGQPFADIGFGSVLLFLQVLSFFTCIWQLHRRRSLWYNHFGPGWAAFTFPACSNATCTLLFVEKLRLHEQGSVLATWALIGPVLIGAYAVVITLGVGACFAVKLTTWVGSTDHIKKDDDINDIKKDDDAVGTGNKGNPVEEDKSSLQKRSRASSPGRRQVPEEKADE